MPRQHFRANPRLRGSLGPENGRFGAADRRCNIGCDEPCSQASRAQFSPDLDQVSANQRDCARHSAFAISNRPMIHLGA
jgi:hypothetical protein